MNGITKAEVDDLAAQVLTAEIDHVAYEMSATEQFYFLHKCRRVIAFYTEQDNGEEQS
jgi:hypothetical protein